MKLELKHWAAYLPYNLRIFWLNCNISLRLIGVCTEKEFVNQVFCQFKDNSRSWVDLSENQFKPLLHPLSSLTKVIEHNGERFMPILRLLGLDSKELIIKEIYCFKNSFNSYSVGVKYHHVNHEDNIFISSLSFGKGNLDVIRYDYVQRLLSWHFDIFDLIENNLAIPIEV